VRKVTLLLVGSAWLAAGCSILQDDYYDPYATSYDFGQQYSMSVYQLPFAYYQRCYGFYRSCLFYRPPYVPVPGAAPDQDRVIPLTHPPIMANDDALIVWQDFDARESGGKVALDGLAVSNDLYEPRPAVRKSERGSGPVRMRPMNRPMTGDRSGDKSPRASAPTRVPARASSKTRPSRASSAGRGARPGAPRSATRSASRAVRSSASGPRTPSPQAEP
jgi:hypothetical protein